MGLEQTELGHATDLARGTLAAELARLRELASRFLGAHVQIVVGII